MYDCKDFQDGKFGAWLSPTNMDQLVSDGGSTELQKRHREQGRSVMVYYLYSIISDMANHI